MLPRLHRQFLGPRQDAERFLTLVDDERLQPVVDRQHDRGDHDGDQR